MKLYELSAYELAEKIRSGEATAVEAVESALERIGEVEGRVDALLYHNADEATARAQAVQAEIGALRKTGKPLPPLAGVPVVVKDNMCTKGVKTTCASKILYNFIPPYNAIVVEKLHANLAVIIGKANMDEFAMGSSCEHSAFKLTRNPWDLSRVPGGSSGGSAASVASCEAPLALGSDTGGSIRLPASFCGVTGMKPTYGAVSRYGLVAFASSLDQIGPLARDARDAALLFDAIKGHDPMDSTSANIGQTPCLEGIGREVGGLRIGLPKEYFGPGVEPGVREAVMRAAKAFERMGATVDEVRIPALGHALSAYYLISSAEASSNLARFDGVRYGYRSPKARTGEDLYVESRSEGFGAEVKRRIMLGTYALCSGYYDEYYTKALKVRSLVKRGFDEAFEKFDALLSPVAASPAFKLGERTGDALAMYLTDLCTVSVNIAGLPGISVPCGFAAGLPVGMQLIGKPFGEAALLRAAHAFQMETDYHLRRPEL
jgi:aspartyl-tRNA(Asn)/glutamyl-tRNA(Gln) amidotransferase subunit A